MHCKRSALADRARDRDIAAHQLAEVVADRQSQPAAAILACSRGIALSERLKQAPHLLGADANAGVGNLKDDEVLSSEF